MKKFTATIVFTQYSKATVEVEAKTRDEAWRKAETIAAADVMDWDPFDGNVDVISVEPAKTRKRRRCERR